MPRRQVMIGIVSYGPLAQCGLRPVGFVSKSYPVSLNKRCDRGTNHVAVGDWLVFTSSSSAALVQWLARWRCNVRCIACSCNPPAGLFDQRTLRRHKTRAPRGEIQQRMPRTSEESLESLEQQDLVQQVEWLRGAPRQIAVPPELRGWQRAPAAP